MTHIFVGAGFVADTISKRMARLPTSEGFATTIPTRRDWYAFLSGTRQRRPRGRTARGHLRCSAGNIRRSQRAIGRCRGAGWAPVAIASGPDAPPCAAAGAAPGHGGGVSWVGTGGGGGGTCTMIVCGGGVFGGGGGASVVGTVAGLRISLEIGSGAPVDGAAAMNEATTAPWASQSAIPSPSAMT
jgi:hypothetical protein